MKNFTTSTMFFLALILMVSSCAKEEIIIPTKVEETTLAARKKPTISCNLTTSLPFAGAHTNPGTFAARLKGVFDNCPMAGFYPANGICGVEATEELFIENDNPDNFISQYIEEGYISAEGQVAMRDAIWASAWANRPANMYVSGISSISAGVNQFSPAIPLIVFIATYQKECFDL